jgi:hypothetical protein
MSARWVCTLAPQQMTPQRSAAMHRFLGAPEPFPAPKHIKWIDDAPLETILRDAETLVSYLTSDRWKAVVERRSDAVDIAVDVWMGALATAQEWDCFDDAVRRALRRRGYDGVVLQVWPRSVCTVDQPTAIATGSLQRWPRGTAPWRPRLMVPGTWVGGNAPAVCCVAALRQDHAALATRHHVFVAEVCG